MADTDTASSRTALSDHLEVSVKWGTSASEHGLYILGEAISHDAISIPPQGYPPPTSTPARENILRKVEDWIDDPKPSSSVLWIYGSGGAGKSLGAQTIATMCAKTNRLAASFFFRRKDGANQSRQLFTTIAYQLANNVPGLRFPIDHAMSLHPTLPNQSVDIQFQRLIVEPFAQSTSIPLRSFIVVIDALDQCDDEEAQLSILSLITEAVTVSKLPLRFLITSRREIHLEESFGENPLCSATTVLSLDETAVSQTSLPSNTFDTNSNPSRPALERLLPQAQSRRLPRTNPPYSASSYPRIVTIQQSNGNAESYSRSLLMLGHGFPLWYPGGDLGKPTEYLQTGLRIGDVGVLDREGIFDFCFNIFIAPDDPVHARLVPREFEPISPPLNPDEIHRVPHYFKRGEVITSPGIIVTKEPEDPLNVSFKSTEQEGAMLILPGGASREDLKSTDRFRAYIKKNAPHWYQVINGYGGVIHTNGSLFLVTGCDKASDWAAACFPHRPGDTAAIDLKYSWRPEYAYPWSGNGRVQTRFYSPKDIPTVADTKNQCIFVRGMRISLSEPSWEDTMPRLKSSSLYYTYILHKSPSLDLWINSLLVFFRLRMSERQALKKVTASRLQLFHPNFIIAQALLGKCPDAEVSLVDDSVWCDLTEQGYCTLSEINKLVTAVFEKNNIVEVDGTVTLVPLKPSDPNHTTTARIHSPIKKRSWASPLLSRFHKSSPDQKDEPWVKVIPVGEHAKLF